MTSRSRIGDQFAIQVFPDCRHLYKTNRAAITQLLPRQSHNQRIELLPGQRQLRLSALPVKPPLMQPALRQPDTVAIVHSFSRLPLRLANSQAWCGCTVPNICTTRANKRSAPVRMSSGAVASHH